MKKCYIVTTMMTPIGALLGVEPQLIQFVAVSDKDSASVKEAVSNNIKNVEGYVFSEVFVVELSLSEIEDTYRSMRGSAIDRTEGNVIYADFGRGRI